MSAPANLENLTALAFQTLEQLEKLDVTEGYLTFARAIFKGVCLGADAMLRLHPESCHHAPWGRPGWNPTAMAALARVLLDGCVTLHYFALDDVTQEEREFRFIVANLHCMREREDSARIMEAGRPLEPPPDDWSDVPQSEYPVMKARLDRSQIPKQLEHWRDELARNNHFIGLPLGERAKWLDGKGLYNTHGEYGGGGQDAGFVLRRRERARRAGFSMDRYDLLYRHLSAHSHIAPHAISQLRAFNPGDKYSLAVIERSVQVASAAVAVATQFVTQAFLDCEVRVTPDLLSLLLVCRSLLLDVPAPLPDNANKGSTTTAGESSCTGEDGPCQ